MARSLLVRELDWIEPEWLAAALRRRFEGVFWLDSAREGDPRSRYSYLGADPFLELRSKNGQIRLGERAFTGDPFALLRRLLADWRQPHELGLPPFQTGLVGCFGYDLCHHLERLPAPPADPLAFPDLLAGFYDVIFACDLRARRLFLLSSGLPEPPGAARAWRQRRRLECFLEVAQEVEEPAAPDSLERPLAIHADFSRAEYERAVARVVEYVHAGDIFQANLAQRFSAELQPPLDPFLLHRRLRRVNAAPFAAFLEFGELALASASPERFLELRGRRVETRPIKGTRPRAEDPEEDARLARELCESDKDRAENVMIVDLLRNDLSRVCRDHTVEVPELCTLESFATVHHLVSAVRGELLPERDAVDLLRAAFPGGSITGAPKIRAMEIIAELEPVRRGPYCGAIGWIGFDGWMDTNIVIRTFVIRGRQVTFHVGGGIVADSDPAAEYRETLDKARGLVRALRGWT